MFFKRREKPEKVLPEDASTFQKLWHNKRTHALMILGMYFVFIAFVLILISCGNQVASNLPTNNTEEIDSKTFEEIKKDMTESDYSFEYDIRINDDSINFKGQNIDKIETGYKENKEEIIKYEIDGENTYKIKGTEKIEITNLYSDINYDLISLPYIFLLTNYLEYEETINKNTKELRYKDVTIVTEEIFDIVITIKENKITNILISNEKNIYNLTYS